MVYSEKLMNPILNVDSYKHSHLSMYPKGITNLFSYIEARGGEFDDIVPFGIQAFVNSYLQYQITRKDVIQAKKLILAHGEPFTEEQYSLWMNIIDKYNGYLPLRINSVKEGLVLKPKNILVSIESTDPDYFWLPSYIETQLLRAVWYPTTVASVSYACKKILWKYCTQTSDNPQESIKFRLHDFGGRGCTSHESSMIGGAAHLVNFYGTDTLSCLPYIQEYYADCEYIVGYSIPASEHGVITIWGRENEERAYENILDHYAKKGKMVAVVSDSYNIYHAVQELWGNSLREKLLNSEAVLVIRPDSGEPTEILPELLSIAAKVFGYTINSKGYKLLPPYVRFIQGDGMTRHTINDICKSIVNSGFSIDNVNFGMGKGLLQDCDRDTSKFAQKVCAASTDNGETWFDVYKDPITDSGKMSKKGRQKLIFTEEEYKTVGYNDERYSNYPTELQTIYYNGQTSNFQHFDEIRERANRAFIV